MTREERVALIRGMARRGDAQMHIGTYFGMNQGRVNEIIRGKVPWAKGIAPRPPHLLPPAGPYLVVSAEEYQRVNDAAAIPVRVLDSIMLAIEKIALDVRKLNEARSETEGARRVCERPARIDVGHGMAEGSQEGAR